VSAPSCFRNARRKQLITVKRACAKSTPRYDANGTGMVRNDVAVKAVTVVEKNNSEPAIPSSFLLVVERSIAKIVVCVLQAFEFECRGMRTTPFSPLTDGAGDGPVSARHRIRSHQ
jgi:hypothetical protein